MGSADQPVRPETASKVALGMREAQAETERMLLDLVDRRRISPPSIDGLSAIFDAIELVLLVRFELAVLMEDLATPRGSLRANFYGRMLLLTVYESSLSLRSILGRPFREALALAFAHLDLGADLRNVHSRINRLAQKCTEEYGEIRNGIIAHRDQDAECRMQLLEKISGSHVIDLALELSQVITEFLRMTTRLLQPVNGEADQD
jgi:hypothetical protein